MPERCGIEKNPFSKFTNPTLHPEIKRLPEQPQQPLTNCAVAYFDPRGPSHTRSQNIFSVIDLHQHFITCRDRNFSPHLISRRWDRAARFYAEPFRPNFDMCLRNLIYNALKSFQMEMHRASGQLAVRSARIQLHSGRQS